MKTPRISITINSDIQPSITLKINENAYNLCICHHRPDRSIRFLGLENYFCSRCLGIIFGILIGILLLVFGIYLSFIIALISIIPLILDGLSQLFGYRESNNIIRLFTGLLYGIGTINYLISQLLL